VPGDRFSGQLIEEFIVQRVGNLIAGLDNQPGMKPVEHAGNAAKMVGMCVGDDGHRKLPCAMTYQERDHDAASGIAPIVPGARIDQNPSASRRPQQGPVALTHVEKM
jgi:hypothetical protein